MTRATKTGTVDGLVKPAGKFGKAELGTVAPPVEEAEKHAVMRRNGKRDRTFMENIDGGVGGEIGCR